ncbi:hypothetical protein ACHAW5_007958 [Stephanodiscus triporus]|uniref:PPPDE domain-containing protein n=1 Tax=Stephanodiscus triporus TaxID=2934178 RepID=A0ABD3PCN3_9STRA
MNFKVPIPKGMRPGQDIKVRSPPFSTEGSKEEHDVVTTIPPRSQWQYDDGDAAQEPFFVIRIEHVCGGDSHAITSSSHPPHWREMRKRDIAMDVARKTAKELTTKREAGLLPKAVMDLIEAMEGGGVGTVESMTVVRTPVQEYVCRLMDVISIGKYREAIAESPYDTMFHLSLLINGRYRLEKNEVITLSDSGPSYIIPEGSDTMEVNIPPRERGEDASSILSVRSLLHNTRDHMGRINFSNYCAVTNNCQDFTLAVLVSNGLTSPDLMSFIKQDVGVIFDKLPIHTPKLARKLTNAAAIGDKLKENIAVTCKENVSEEKVTRMMDGIATSFGLDRGKVNFGGIVPKQSGSFDRISLNGKSS